MALPDVLIVGAGIFGLSVAWSCRKAGLSVQVLEALTPGAGASGGVVGALTPHAPSRWRAMMAFQFHALLSLETRIAEIESATGRDCGYARTGRLTPLATEKARAGAERDVAAQPDTWGNAAAYEILEEVPTDLAGWIRPEAASHGLVHDTVSARVDPRAYVKALATSLRDNIDTGVAVRSIDPSTSSVRTTEGIRTADHLIVAAGWQAWELLTPHVPVLSGTAVKGQAAVLAADASGLPVIYQDGLYIIPHGSDRVAVGSTSEKTFEDGQATDGLLDDVLVKARAICPALAEATVLERWAGLRPKPPGREPVVGPLTLAPHIWVAGGGFKISFGIAHAVGDAIAAGILGNTPELPLPATFAPSANA
ncbi:MAG: NAD(P)/FAD-dependent oxidoreductase [Paracoccaceae bacterium]